MGLSPAWCLTERELIVAPMPQNIMAYLKRPQGQKSLAAVPQVGRLFAGRDGPSLLAHIDTLRVFELVYPLVPTYAQLGLNEVGGGYVLPPDAFPSFPALRRHLVPGTATLRRTKHGLELTSRQPLPGTGLLWTSVLAMQSPQALEQQIANEGRPMTDSDPFWGLHEVPPPSVGPAPQPEAMPGAAAPAGALAVSP